MNRLISTILASSILLSSITASSTSFGDQSTNSVDDPGKITPLKKGQSAPYPGVLFSPKAAAVVATELSSAKDKTKIEIAAAVSSAEAKKDFKINEINAQCKTDREALTAQLEEKTKNVDRLMKNLKEKEDSTPNRSLWGGLGFASGVVATLIVVFAANSIGSSFK